MKTEYQGAVSITEVQRASNKALDGLFHSSVDKGYTHISHDITAEGGKVTVVVELSKEEQPAAEPTK